MLKGIYNVLISCHRTTHNIRLLMDLWSFSRFPSMLINQILIQTGPQHHGVMYMTYGGWATAGKPCW